MAWGQPCTMTAAEAGELDFTSVGQFLDDIPAPSAPGRYRYEPCRSGAHLELQEKLRRGTSVPCRLTNPDGTVVHFIVCGCPRYGVLKIAFNEG